MVYKNQFYILGFTFNPKFTNEESTCMIIGENIFAMLTDEKLKELFQDTTFPGSFSGSRNFQTFLKMISNFYRIR